MSADSLQLAASKFLCKNTVKPRKREHSKIREPARLILWGKAPKDKNQQRIDLFQCSYETVHLMKKIHHISVNKLPNSGN